MAATGPAISVVIRAIPTAIAVSAAGGPAVAITVATCAAIVMVGYGIYRATTAKGRSS